MTKTGKLALALFVLANIFWGIVFLIPFFNLSFRLKAIIIPSLAIIGEIFLWISVVLGGKGLVTKYKRFINPLNWFKKTKKKDLINKA